jgi:hypothetical protein
MREHWDAGLTDIRATLANREWLKMPDNDGGFVTHDIHRARKSAVSDDPRSADGVARDDVAKSFEGQG